MTSLYADYSTGSLTGEQLRTAGFVGAIRYVGTPGRQKNTTPAEMQSHCAAGLDDHGVYEDGTGDFLGGHASGVSRARAALDDAHACGLPGNRVIFMTADRHLTTAELPVWKSYLDGARTILGSRIGAYGFSEALIVASEIGIGTHWGCGNRTAVSNAFAHWYQRNSGETQRTVAGITCDINELWAYPDLGGWLTMLTDAQQADLYAKVVETHNQVTGGYNEDGTLRGWPGLSGDADGTLVDMARFCAVQLSGMVAGTVNTDDVVAALMAAGLADTVAKAVVSAFATRLADPDYA